MDGPSLGTGAEEGSGHRQTCRLHHGRARVPATCVPPTSAWPRPGLCSVLGFNPLLSGPAERLGAERTLTGLKARPHGARLCCQTQGCCCTGTAMEGPGLRPTPGTGGTRSRVGAAVTARPTRVTGRRAGSWGPAAASPRVQGSQAGQQLRRRAGVPNMGAGKCAEPSATPDESQGKAWCGLGWKTVSDNCIFQADWMLPG